MSFFDFQYLGVIERNERTTEYLDYINNPNNSPLDIIYEIQLKVNSWHFWDIWKEARIFIYEETEEQKKHKQNVLLFLFEKQNILK